MKFRIIPTQIFIRKVKRYKRKYVNILKDIDKLVDLLRENPKAGVHLKHSVYKIRLKFRYYKRKIRGFQGNLLCSF